MTTRHHPRALMLLAEGAEEMETVITVDVLRRGEVHVVVAGLDGPGPVRCSRGVHIVPDSAFADTTGVFDIIVMPGGKGGADKLAQSHAVGDLLRAQVGASRRVGAICAAPIALASHGVFAGARMTCHPSVNDIVAAHGVLEAAPVVVDGLLVTSQGPGTTFPFALTIVELLCGPNVRDKVRAPLMLDGD